MGRGVGGGGEGEEGGWVDTDNTQMLKNPEDQLSTGEILTIK